MKTRNRIITLLLAACLLLSMGAVSVWAAETAVAEKTVEYSFQYKEEVTLKTTSSGTAKWSEARNITALGNAYADRIINSMPAYWNLDVCGQPTAYTADKGIIANAYVGDWVAVKIKSPGAGRYAVAVTPNGDSGSAQQCNVYIYPGNTEQTVVSAEVSAYRENQTDLTVGTFIGNLNLNINNAPTTIGYPEFTKNTEYIVVFQAAQSGLNTKKPELASIMIAGMTMTQSVTADNVAAEISNAPCGSTIKLNADCDTGAEAVTVGKGVTMDLNGKTLTATVNAEKGIVKDTTGGKGSIVGSAIVNAGEGAVALTKDNVSRIFGYTLTEDNTPVVKTVEEKTQVGFWFKAELSADAYTMLADGAAGLTVGATMQWTPTGGEAVSRNYVLSAEQIIGWAGVAGSGDYWFYVNVTGFESLTATGTLEVVPTVNGVTGNAIAYSVN